MVYIVHNAHAHVIEAEFSLTYYIVLSYQGLIEPPKAARVLCVLDHIYSIEMELKSDYGFCL